MAKKEVEGLSTTKVDLAVALTNLMRRDNNGRVELKPEIRDGKLYVSGLTEVLNSMTEEEFQKYLKRTGKSK